MLNTVWTFIANLDFNLFNTEVVRLGTYFSHLASLKEAILKKLSCWPLRISVIVMTGSPGVWYVCCVHLSDKGMRVVVSATAKCVHLLKVVPSAQIPTMGDRIPLGTVFSVWVKTFRELCGFVTLKPYNSRKRTSSHSGQQRPLKQ